MQHWDLRALEVRPRSPQILHSLRGETRSVAIDLPAGEALRDHQVREYAHLVVVDGSVEIEQGDERVLGGPGFLAVFEPGERRELRASSDARLLLVLAPWPGEGHGDVRF